jgi:PAS domain S-box-containing protein
MQVLIVSQSENRSIIVAAVKSRGHAHSVHRTVNAVIRDLQRKHCPIVIVDTTLPKLDALDLCQQIRDTQGQHRPVVLCILDDLTPERISTALDSGADDCIASPITAESITTRLAVIERRLPPEPLTPDEVFEKALVEYTAAADLTPETLFVTSVDDGTIHYVNETGRQLTGLTGEHFGSLKRDLDIWGRPDDRDYYIETIREYGECLNLSTIYHGPDGREFPVVVNGRRVEIGGRSCVIVTFHDSTNIVRAEQQMRTTKEMLDSVLHASDDAIIATDTDLNITIVNAAAVQLFDLDENVIGTSVHDVRCRESDLRQVIQDALDHVASHGRYSTNVRLKQPSDEERVLHIQVYQRMDVRDQYAGYVFSWNDVTEQREEAHQRQQIYRQNAFIASRFLNVDPDDLNDEIDNTFRQIGEMIGVDRLFHFLVQDGSSAAITHEWTAEHAPQTLKDSILIHQESMPWAVRKLSDGKIVVIDSVAGLPERAAVDRELLTSLGIKSMVIVPVLSDETRQTIIGFTMTREERKWTADETTFLATLGALTTNAMDLARSKKALRESEERHRRLVENLGREYFFYLHDTDGIVTYVSPSVTKMLGYGQEEFATHFSTYLTDNPTNDEATSRSMESIRGNKQPPYLVETFKKSGDTCWLEVTEIPLFDADGAVVAVEGIAHDITERKQMEEDLRESEGHVRAKLDAILMPEGDIGELELGDVIDIEAVQSVMDDFYDLTPFAAALLDIKGNVLTQVGWQDICTKFHRVNPETCANCLESDTVLSSGLDPGEMKLYRCRNGMNDLVTPLYLGEEHVGNIFVGQLFFDDEDVDREFFRGQAQRYGFDEEEYLAALDRVPRLSRERVDEAMRFYARFANQLSTLSYANIRLARTLTERDRITDALRDSESFFRTLIDTIPDVVWMKNLQGIFLSCNPRFEQLHGMKGADVVGKTAHDFMDRTLANHFQQSDLMAVTSGKPYVSEEEIDSADDGRHVFYETTKTPMYGPDGEPIGVLGIAHDITERKQAEEALRESEGRVRAKLDAILMPEGDIGELELGDVIDIEAAQSVMDDFYDLTPFAAALLDIKGNVLTQVGWQDICTKFHRVNPETCANCLESDTVLSSGLGPGETKIYRCRNGLNDLVTPLYLGEEHVGNIFVGQLFFDDEEVDREFFRRQAQRYGFDEEEYLAALDRVPRLSRERVDEAMRFYARFANQLSTLSYANIRLARTLIERDRITDDLRDSEVQYRYLFEMESLRVKFSSAFMNAEPEDTWTVLNETLASIGEFVGVDRVVLWIGDTRQLELRAQWCADGIRPANDVGHTNDFTSHSVYWSRLLNGENVVISDTQKIPEVDTRETLGRIGISAQLLVPLHSHGEHIGHIGFNMAHEPRVWSRDDIATLEAFASAIQTALFLDSSREALRRNESLLNTTQKLAKIGGWEWDIERQRMYWTDELYNLHGIPHDHLPDGSPRHIEKSIECYDPEDQAKVMGAFQQCAETGEPYDLELPFTSMTDHRMWVRTSTRAVMEDGKVVRVIGDFMDITTRKHAEEALEKEARLQQILSTIANEFITISPSATDDGIDRALEAIGEFVDADRGYVIMFDFPAGTITNTHEWYREGIEPQIDNIQAQPIEAFGWAINQLVELRVVHVPRVSDLPTEARSTREEFEAQGIQSLLLVPLASEGKCVGTAGFDFVRRTRSCSEDEIRLLQLSGTTLSYALYRQQADEALRESEERYRRLFEMESAAILLVDLETLHIVDANPGASTLYGYSSKELTQMSIADLSREPLNTSNALRTGVRWIPRAYHKKNDGTDITVEMANDTFTLGGREVAVGICRDITERLHVEDEVQQQRAFLREIVENTPSAIYVKDREGRIILANRAFAEYVEMPYEEVVGSQLDRAMTDHDTSSWMEHDHAVLHGHAERIEREQQYTTANGTTKWVSAVKVPLKDDEGNITGLLGVSTDITEIKETEENLRHERDFIDRIMDTSTSAIVTMDIEGRIIFANKQTEELARTTREELYKKSYNSPEWGSVDQDGHPIPDEEMIFAKAVKTRKPVLNQFRTIERADGTTIMTSINAAPMFDANGDIEGVVSIYTDITESVEATQSLQESERRFREMLENLQLISLMLDGQGHLTFCNDYLLELTGWTREEIIGKDWVQTFVPECDRSSIAEWRLFEGDDPDETESFETHHTNDIRTKNGDTRTIQWNNTILRDSEGALSGYASIGRDITERIRAERALVTEHRNLEQHVRERTTELQTANAQLARANRMKDEFLASMSHELRTPLTAILGISEALQEQVFGSLNEKQDRFLKRIHESGQHLLSLINDILDLSKIEAGRVVLDYSDAGVKELCESSLRFIHETASIKSITVEIDLPEEHVTLWVDERRFKQVLVNLLSNAVKFTPENGAVGLDVHTDANDGVISFSVWDSGIGIAQESMVDLFQPFVQLDSSLSRQYPGTGLGLALVKRLTDLHGGGITVESVVGEGSRFTVSLPWVSSGSGVTATSDQSHVAPRIDTQSGGPLVLLAEDNEENITALLEYLQARGFRVEIARDGIEAVDRTTELHPDIILMDIQMPKLSGLDAIRLIRKDPDVADIPIIAVTTLAMVGDRERCIEAGATDYLSKPVSLRRLTDLIFAILEGDKPE